MTRKEIFEKKFLDVKVKGQTSDFVGFFPKGGNFCRLEVASFASEIVQK